MYALVDDDTGLRLGEFMDIDGFFVAEPGEYGRVRGPIDAPWLPIEFTLVAGESGTALANARTGAKPANCRVEILSRSGEGIGEYYVAAATLHGPVSATSGPVMEVSGLVELLPGRGAKALWEAWAVAPPARTGVWAELPVGSREAWLEVAGLYRRSYPTSSDAHEILMDGAEVKDLASFFCAYGEAVNGPGGYYGWNFQALVDCLGGGHGARAPFILHWSDFGVAQSFLVDVVESAGRRLNELELIVEIFQEAGVDIRA